MGVGVIELDVLVGGLRCPVGDGVQLSRVAGLDGHCLGDRVADLGDQFVQPGLADDVDPDQLVRGDIGFCLQAIELALAADVDVDVLAGRILDAPVQVVDLLPTDHVHANRLGGPGHGAGRQVVKGLPSPTVVDGEALGCVLSGAGVEIVDFGVGVPCVSPYRLGGRFLDALVEVVELGAGVVVVEIQVDRDGGFGLVGCPLDAELEVLLEVGEVWVNADRCPCDRVIASHQALPAVPASSLA